MAMGTQMGSLPAGGAVDGVTRNRARRARLQEMMGAAGPNNPAKPAGGSPPPGAGGGGWSLAGKPPLPPGGAPPPGQTPGYVPWNDPGFATSGGGPDRPLTDQGTDFTQGLDAFLPAKSMEADPRTPGGFPAGGGMAGVYANLLTQLSMPGGRTPGTGGLMSYGDDARPMEMPGGPTMGIDPQPGGGMIPAGFETAQTASPASGYDWMSSYLGGAPAGPSITPYGNDAMPQAIPPDAMPSTPNKPDMTFKPRPKPTSLGPGGPRPRNPGGRRPGQKPPTTKPRQPAEGSGFSFK